jgi:ketosteroid isomerase-like protein
MDPTENTKIVQECYEKFGAGDIEGLLSRLNDNIDWTTPTVENAGFSGTRKGKTAVAEFFTQLAAEETFSRFEPLEFVAQDDKVVVIGELASTVTTTGKAFETEWVHIFHLANGKITSFKEFFDTAKTAKAFQLTATA